MYIVMYQLTVDYVMYDWFSSEKPDVKVKSLQ
jgi:hypothetical protein